MIVYTILLEEIFTNPIPIGIVIIIILTMVLYVISNYIRYYMFNNKGKHRWCGGKIREHHSTDLHYEECSKCGKKFYWE